MDIAYIWNSDEPVALVAIRSPDGRLLAWDAADADDIERQLRQRKMLYARSGDTLTTEFRLLSYLPHNFHPLRGMGHL